MVILPGGVSLVVAGLDHWFGLARSEETDPEEFRVEEWRLQRALGVNHFRLPPDYREPSRIFSVPNTKITIPAFRFPAWHVCPRCRLLTKRSLIERGSRGKISCPECSQRKETKFVSLYQVPFVAICQNGHLNEFPWSEWVHRERNPQCEGRKLRLFSRGSATLAGQLVRCEDCGKERNLAGITGIEEGTGNTDLTKNLLPDEEFLCTGQRPWLGEVGVQACHAPLKGSLRSASNVYFAQISSSIYLPKLEDARLDLLMALLEQPPLSALAAILQKSSLPITEQPAALRSQQSELLSDYSDAELQRALEVFYEPSEENSDLDKDEAELSSLHGPMRRQEFNVLKEPRDSVFLKSKQLPSDSYSEEFSKFFSKIILIDKLRETRVLSGFTRVFPDNSQSVEQKKAMFWKDETKTRSWLPAYIVSGEGLFFEFNEELLQDWEKTEAVVNRVAPLLARFEKAQERRRLKSRALSPRFVLAHTFAHLMINRLTFECGYSSAALRERLFVSDDFQSSMAGILIYTADGDAEGTLGGLVRMGRPGIIEPVIRKALEKARWCSADPVCMEIGLTGQGPDLCNLSACHNCALVPETACEEFNRFLDRGLVVGTPDNALLGFFNATSRF